MCNAELEGGPRNGIMTALEDFLGEYEKPVRLVVVPTYFGLAIVAEQERLAQHPALAAALDRIEGAEGKQELLELAETLRIQAMVFQHTSVRWSQRKLETAAHRYLELLKGSLLNEHYLENEIRLKYLARAATNGFPVEADRVRDPIRAQPGVYTELLRRRRAGTPAPDENANGFLPYATIGRTRLDHLETCLDTIRADAVPGDLVECSTGRGGAAIFMRGYLAIHEEEGRKLWVADRFRATPAPGQEPVIVDESMSELQADLNLVRDAFERFDLLDEQIRFLQGPLEATLPAADIETVALLRLGRGVGEEAAARTGVPVSQAVNRRRGDRRRPERSGMWECGEKVPPRTRHHGSARDHRQERDGVAQDRAVRRRPSQPRLRRRASCWDCRWRRLPPQMRSTSRSSWSSTTCAAKRPARSDR